MIGIKEILSTGKSDHSIRIETSSSLAGMQRAWRGWVGKVGLNLALPYLTS